MLIPEMENVNVAISYGGFRRQHGVCDSSIGGKNMRKGMKRIILGLVTLVLCLSCVGCGRGDRFGAPVDGETDMNDPDLGDVVQNTFRFTADYAGDEKDCPGAIYKKVTVEDARKQGRSIIKLDFPYDDGVVSNAVKQYNSIQDDYYVDIRFIKNYDPYRKFKPGIETIPEKVDASDILWAACYDIDYSLLDKGYLVDLAPYMELCGITEENYYSTYAAYQSNEHTYGIAYQMSPLEVYVDSSLMLFTEDITMDDFLNALIQNPGKNGFSYRWKDPAGILSFFLKGSETMYDMIDWDRRWCDFDTELFRKIVWVTVRYCKDGQEGYAPILNTRPLYDRRREPVDAEPDKSVSLLNYCFENEWCPFVEQGLTGIFLVNGNSQYIEGAWDFLSYLMSKRGQDRNGASVYRSICLDDLRSSVGAVIYDEAMNEYTCTEENEAIVEESLEMTRYLYDRHDPVIRIMADEIEDWMKNLKDFETYGTVSYDVTYGKMLDRVQNKVRDYLNSLTP